MTVLFGGPWGAPIDDGAQFVETPVGAECLECGEPIAEDDRGLIMPLADLVDGQLVSRAAPTHQWCFLRTVLGSVEHLTGACSCHDPAATAPQGTYAEQAQRVRAWFANNTKGRLS
jgi:hypothetical protein